MTQINADEFPVFSELDPIRVHRRSSAVNPFPPAGRPANAAERETLRRANRQSRSIRSGCRGGHLERLEIPRRDQDHSRKANRVKRSTGSGNARWRREPGGGNTDPPEIDPLRVSARKKAEREKLNDERGVKPLPVSCH